MSKSERKREILDAACRLFQHYGVSKTTISDIATEAGVGVGSVYLDFSSKDEIIEELAREHHERILRELRETIRGRERFAERLRAYLDARVEAFLRIAEVGNHAFELIYCGSCKPVCSAYSGFRDEEKRLLTALLEEAVDEGEFVLEDPELTAEAILRAYANFSPPVIFQRRGGAQTRLLEVLHRLVIEGLLRR